MSSLCTWALPSSQAQERTEPIIQTSAQSQQRPLTGSKPSTAHPAARGMFPGQQQTQLHRVKCDTRLHLLWVLATLQEGRQERKKQNDFPFFHLRSISHFFLFLFTSQTRLLWHARWTAFIATSLKGCWFRFLE